MSSGKQCLYVVVWEWENKQHRWRPYPPEVAQQLERAREKGLTAVFLGDTDPSLKNYCINLFVMRQECQLTGEKVSVRRSFFPQSSPAGQGAVWQWQGDNPGDWHVYDMCVQCIIESEWATGAQALDLCQTFPLCPYVISFCNLTQINNRTQYTRSIRRIQQAPYPVGKPPSVPHPRPIDQGPSLYIDRSRRRGSRGDEIDTNIAETKPNSIMKRFVNCAGSSSSSKSPSSRVDDSEYRAAVSTKGERNHSPPRSNPPSRRGPVPMPRTFLPAQQNEQGAGRYGSDRTLDSDCSSVSGRRPSADTISTYLSDDPNHNPKYQNHDDRSGNGDPRVDRLIKVDSDDEPMDDDVFGIDPEVCEVMGGATLNSPSHRNSSPQGVRGANSPGKRFQFTPITPGQSHSENDKQLNGHKRKRTGELAGLHHHQGAVGTDGGYRDNHFRNSCSSHQHPHQQRNYPYSDHRARAPIRPEDKLLVQFTRTVLSPPDEMCSICMWNLQESSGFSDDDQAAAVSDDGVVSLSLCDHRFHLACIRQMVKATPQFLECPNCKTMHGEKMGNQPEGKMRVITLPQSLPGYRGCGTIQITYCINDGVQGPEHPHPGRHYRAIGFPRIAYLPNNEKGNKVLKLLQEAWRRRLIFTIGTSVTTGLQDAVTWNEIHHKTEWNNYSGHGYPDPKYLDNVLMELAAHGVSETTLV